LTPDDPVSIDAERLKQWNVSDVENKAIVESEQALIAPSLVAATIADICNSTKDGALLAFLPGIGEIFDVERILRDPAGVFGIDFNDRNRFKIYILYSKVPKEQQDEVFLALPPGIRRIILSTNIA
jgi:ATP-dependent RNA helicase DHX36